MAAANPPPAMTFQPPPYQWTGDLIDGDVLAAVALFFFPLLTFYGRKQFFSAFTAGSIVITAYAAYLVRQCALTITAAHGVVLTYFA